MLELKKVEKKELNSEIIEASFILNQGNIYVLKGDVKKLDLITNILALTDKEYDGEYLYNGTERKTLSSEDEEKILKEISLITNYPFFVPEFTVLENLLFVRENKRKINYLAKEAGISKLLQKYPSELTQFEKVKVAFFLANLIESKVIILTEPTKNFQKDEVVKWLEILRTTQRENKIILITTNKNIYDSIADHELCLENGKITSKKEQRKKEDRRKTNSTIVDESHSMKYEYLFAKERRNLKMLSFFSYFFCFLFILMMTSFLIYLKNDFWLKKSEEYPIQVFEIERQNYGEVERITNKIYENYRITEEEYTAYILLDKEDSNFYVFDMIKYGSFPKEENEILVNMEFVQNNFSDIEYEEVIGQTIKIKKKEFIIQGIIDKDGKSDYDSYLCNGFYTDVIKDNEVTSAIFIPYKTMEKIGKKFDTTTLLVSIEKEEARKIYSSNSDKLLYKDEEIFKNNGWKDVYISEENRLFSYFCYIVCFSIIVLLLLTIVLKKLFKRSLEKRRQEIGYLHLLHISKDRIYFIFLINYFYEIITTFISALIIFLLLRICIFHIYDVELVLSWSWILLIFFAILVYFYFLIGQCINFYLKKGIAELLKEEN